MGAARVADELSHLVGTVAAQGRGVEVKPSSGGGGRARNPKIRFESATPTTDGGAASTIAQFTVTPAKNSTTTTVRMRVGAALDGATSDPDLDPDLELLLATWTNGSKHLSGHEDTIEIDGGNPVRLDLTVQRGHSTSVMFDVTAEKTAT